MTKTKPSPARDQRRSENLGRSFITGTMVKKPISMSAPGRVAISRKIRAAVEKIVSDTQV